MKRTTPEEWEGETDLKANISTSLHNFTPPKELGQNFVATKPWRIGLTGFPLGAPPVPLTANVR